MKKIVFALSMSLAFIAASEEANTLFSTLNAFPSETLQAKAALTNRESLPSEAFPEGNWGQITNGLQLSIRFEHAVFTNGEPIIAIILLRNTTTNSLDYNLSLSDRSDGPVGFKVFDEHGSVSPIPPGELNVSARGAILPPRTQRKYIERLDNKFQLTPGTYTVLARYGTFIRRGKTSSRPFEITSGATTIKIENPK